MGLVVVSVAAVISAELANTAIVRDPRIRDIKDLAAGAVLVVAMGAAINGLIIFGPRLLPWPH